ncbi:MAG: helix-turn-helix domain-containing protein [Lachnospiraceae bacterium]|nr:helix-turn-helix domain-containing protein [Lachnospiraceae bacterium]
MMHAYDENLLYKAQITLAHMLDTAVYSYGYDLKEFYNLFLKSKYSKRFERGESAVVAGKSGTELAYEVILENEDVELKESSYSVQRSVEYWVGWSLGFYQWYTGKNFKEINEIADMDVFVSLYSIYHEMDIMHLVDYLDERSNKQNSLKLKRLRAYAGLSQKELADKTGIPLRTIQQYEQGQKDIAHARAESLIKIARALYCEVEDIV